MQQQGVEVQSSPVIDRSDACSPSFLGRMDVLCALGMDVFACVYVCVCVPMRPHQYMHSLPCLIDVSAPVRSMIAKDE